MRSRRLSILGITLLSLLASGCSGLWNLVFPLELRLEANDGTGRTSSQSIYAGKTETLDENDFIREGWGFLGWSRNPGASSPDYVDGASFAMGDEDETLYAVWARDTRVITFHANDGGDATKRQELVAGSRAYLRANTFARPGYAFVGWAESAEGPSAQYADDAEYTMGETDIELYALWSDNVLEITFRANGGSGESETSPRTQGIEVGETAYLRGNAFSRPGYAFLGWSSDASAAETEYDDGEDYVATAAGSVELYALWGRNTLAITFHANDGVEPESTKVQNLATGSTGYLRANTFARPGYAFVGWAASATATSAEYADDAEYAMGGSDTDLYALWSQNAHTITFDVNDGDANGMGETSARSIAESGSIALPSGGDFGWSGIEGSIFGGWALSPSAKAPDYAAGSSFAMGMDDVILYALWGYRRLEAVTSLNGVDNYGNDLFKEPVGGVFELGAHYAGNSSTLEIPLKNAGDLPLTISSITLSQTEGYSAFTLSDLPSLPYVIPDSNQLYTFKLTFSCTSEDQYTPSAVQVDAILKIKSDDSDEDEEGYSLSFSGYLGSP